MIAKIKSLKNHQGFMKYFKNTSWLLGEKILRMVVGLFVGIWIARYLGPEQFGLLSYAQSFVGLFTAIATLGLDGIVIRELVKDESKRDALLGTAFFLKVIGAIAVLLVLAIAINFTSNDNFTNILIFIIASATIFQSFNVIDFYFQSKVLSRYVVYANVISLLISSIVKVTLLLNNAPLIAFAWVILFDSVILALGFLYFYFHNQLSIKNWKFSKEMAYALLKDSWPLMLSGMIISIYMKIDQVMIKEMLNNEAVGQYAAALRLSQAWYFIPVILVKSLTPALINARKTSYAEYENRYQSLYNLLVRLTIIVSIVITFTSEKIILILFNEQYLMASEILTVHIWSSIFVSIGVAFNTWLVIENYVKKTFYRSLLGVISNILLNYILIHKYGVLGAAYASLISYVIVDLVYDFFDNDVKGPLKQKIRALLLDTVKGIK